MTHTRHLLSVAIIATLSLTACIQTPEQYQVKDQTRNLFDNDLDGVINARDLCAETVVGAVINNDGCPNTAGSAKEASREILFEFDKDVLTDAEYARLVNMIDRFKTFPEAKVYLIGDTSPEGSDEYNHKLAERRVAEITRILVSQGVNPNNITEQVYFESNIMPQSYQARKHRLVAVAKWSESGTEMSWNIFTSETAPAK